MLFFVLTIEGLDGTDVPLRQQDVPVAVVAGEHQGTNVVIVPESKGMAHLMGCDVVQVEI